MALRLIIAASGAGVLLFAYQAFSRKSGRLVLVAWVVVPLLLVIIDLCVLFTAINAGHCHGEDYGCEHWAPTRNTHVITALLAVGIPALLTMRWVREHRRRGDRPTERARTPFG